MITMMNVSKSFWPFSTGLEREAKQECQALCESCWGGGAREIAGRLRWIELSLERRQREGNIEKE